MVRRGDIWWADMDSPRGSEPGYGRPLLIVQRDAINQSNLNTVLTVALTTNHRRVKDRGNVLIPAGKSGLPKDSVANITQVVTIDKAYLLEYSGHIGGDLMREVDDGLRFIMGLA